MKTCAAIALFGLLWSAASSAQDDTGLQLTPVWSERGELTVRIANRSKLTLGVGTIEARLGEGRRECLWRGEAGQPLGPTSIRTVVLAPASAARACLRLLPGFETLAPAKARFLASARQASTAAASVSDVTLATTVERFRVKHAARFQFTLTRDAGGTP